MSQKISYLLGAGASAESLPVYSNFKERFLLFDRLIRNIQLNQVESFGGNNSLNELKKDSANLLSELEHHSTPDIVAKKYYVQNEEVKLERLKAILIVFFLYEQTCNERPFFKDGNLQKDKKTVIDLRYDSFISRLLKPIKGKIQFEENINILTWNYDFQFEMCCKNFSNKPIDDLNSLFISHPSPFSNSTLGLNPLSFKVLHLNGVAMSSNKEPEAARIIDILTSSHSYSNYPNTILVQLYKHLIFEREILFTPPENHMFFGWENLDEWGDVGDNWPIKNGVKQTCNETEILIIIGYSFPSFNVAIDTFIFKNFNNLHSIFIQDTQFENIKGILEHSYLQHIPKSNKNKIVISDVGYTNQFFIPRSEIAGKSKEINYSFV